MERRGEIWIPKDSYKDEAILAQMPRLAEIRPNPFIAAKMWLKRVVRIENQPMRLQQTQASASSLDASAPEFVLGAATCTA